MKDQNKIMQDLGQKDKSKYKSDIVFCIDGTGSMSPCIEAVKNRIEKVVSSTLSEMAETHGAEFEIRFRLVVFRDVREDGDKGLEVFDFVEDPGAFVSQLKTIEAMGGGDAPESALDGLVIALNSPWRDPKEARRAVALFTDAPSLDKIDASTMGTIGHSDKADQGDAQFVLAMNDKVNAKVFIAGPDCPVFKTLSSDMDYKVTTSESLADVDMEEWLELIFKTVTTGSIGLGTTKIVNE